ncbi:MAG: hypothetical protein ACOC8Y_05745 [Candidatus Natronoplasma sp.]
MLGSGRSRALAVIALLIILSSLFIWFGSLSPAPEKGRFPGNDELVEDYDRYIDKEVEIGGEVIETDPTTIEIESGDRTLQLKIVDLENEVDQGDRLSVFGTVEEDKTVRVQNSIIRPSWQYRYMYGISLVGAVWAGLRLIGGWRFDKEKFAFEPRSDPLTVKETLSLLIRGDDSG